MVRSVDGRHMLRLSLFTGRSQIDLSETEIDDADSSVRIIEVILDHEVLGEVRLWTFYHLGMMVHPNVTTMWSGRWLYWLDIPNALLLSCEQDEEVRAVYVAGSLLLVVRDVSVALFDPETSTIVDLVPLSDVNWGWEWEADKLVVNDFQERQFEITVDGRQLQLREL